MTLSVILNISKKKHQLRFISTTLQRKTDLQKLEPLFNFGCRRAKSGTPTYSYRHPVAGLI